MIRLSFEQSEHNIHIPLAGIYRLYLTGGLSVNGLEYFGVRVTKSDSTKGIIVKSVFFKRRDNIDGKRAVECYHIQFPESGQYQISFRNAEKLSMNRSMLISRNFLFPKKTPYYQMEAILELQL